MADFHPIPTSKRFQDLTGRRFTRLTVMGYLGQKDGRTRWLCVCDCGAEVQADRQDLVRGSTKSCGCYIREKTRARKKHGMHNTPEYKAWVAMRSRCTRPTNPAWDDYGGRGITVCKRWLESFAAFYEDMGPRPSEDHSLDRIDNNRGYYPHNCRWATSLTQNHNLRSNHRVTHEGETLTLAEWSERTGIPKSVLGKRIHAGWPPEEALTTPLLKRERVVSVRVRKRQLSIRVIVSDRRRLVFSACYQTAGEAVAAVQQALSDNIME